MSMPRAAMSVATMALTSPALKAARARSRWPWLLSPWIDAASTPDCSRARATRSAPRLVRVKTITRRKSLFSNSSASRARLRSCSTKMTFCWTFSTVVAWGVTETRTGSGFRSSPASLPISVGMVAEKKRFCRALGRYFTIRRIGRMKPMSSIWSASSRTKVSTPWRVTVFSPRWSIRRPGVATSTSTPGAMARIWPPYFTPPKITVTETPRWRP